MIKYTILYKNGKTWNGKATHLRNILCVDCHIMVATYPYMTNSVRTDVLVPEELLPSCLGWVLKHFSISKVETKKVRQPNPKSKTKKQKAFDGAYVDWAWTKSIREDASIKAYKKWLYEQRLANQSKFVPPPSPGDRIGYYSSESGKMGWITVKDKDGFIPWNGGEMPVPKGTMVHVKYRDGDETICSAGIMSWEEGFEGNMDGRSAVEWNHPHNSIWDIVAYKLHEEVLPEEPQKITFPSGATISWDGVYKPWRESAIEKLHKQVEELKKCMDEAEGIPVDKLTVICTDNTWKELGWGNRTKPIKTTYSFWLGAFGEVADV